MISLQKKIWRSHFKIGISCRPWSRIMKRDYAFRDRLMIIVGVSARGEEMRQVA